MKQNTHKSEPVKTVLIITLGMLVVFLATKWRWALHIGLVVGLLGAFSSTIAGYIDFLWMKLTWVLSKIVPNILLSAIFYLFLTPVALLSRLFGDKNPLSLKNTEKSLFKDYNKNFDAASFEKPW